MEVRPLTDYGFRCALIQSFKDDKDIFKYFDPNVNVESVDDIVSDIERKVEEYGENAIKKGIYSKGKLIGYFVIYHELLVSFALSVEYRKRSFLREFFSIIKKTLNNKFACILWTRNKRAIGWLTKMGMHVVHSNDITTQLICQ